MDDELQQGKFSESLLAELSSRSQLNRMVEMVGPNRGERVLDLGTGTGNVAIELASICETVIAIDADKRAITECKLRIEKAGYASNIEVRLIERQAITQLQQLFKCCSFDIITCRAAFHHFPKPDAVLRGVFETLKPSGRFYLMDPIFSNFAKNVWTPMARLRETDLQSFYSYQDYISLVWNAGFEIVCMLPFLFRRVLEDWVKDAQENSRDRLREVVMDLDERIKSELHFTTENGQVVFYYNGFHMLCRKKG